MSGVKSKLKKAFTLAELMVVLAVMSVVIASVAPILTSKYNTQMSNDVWHNVPADDDGDIYTDGVNHVMLSQIFIGLSPLDLEDIKTNYRPYSKLVIRSSPHISNNVVQKAIEFYHNGNKKGYLFTGKESIMLPGQYTGVLNDARQNTAYGYNALSGVTGGSDNTAIGFRALENIGNGNLNTAIGSYAGEKSSGNRNVFIGYNVNASGDNNTIISENHSNSDALAASYTTAVGHAISYTGNYNVGLGTYADASGEYNTIVGPYAASHFNLSWNKSSNRRNNTAIGGMSCANMANNAQNKTCIGQAGASSAAITGSNSQVFIGRGVNGYNSPAAVVVNNTNDFISGSNLGAASVVVYGNLIVRGQTYLYGQSPFPSNSAAFNPPRNDALIGFTLYKGMVGNHKPYVGLDGSGAAIQLPGDGGYMHQIHGGRENCICNYTGSDTFWYLKEDDGQQDAYTSPGRQSYDWSTDYLFERSFYNTEGPYNYYFSGNANSVNVELSQAHSMFLGTNSATISCCPILTESTRRKMIATGDESSSDARLKNIGSKYLSGLEKLNKLNIYNFTFKSDKLKIPQVGVIAQDLKAIFPNAVSKNEQGYYKIRWDEMFYSAINSVKELNAKIVALVKRIQNDFERIAKLKQENKQLENELVKLADELEKLEKNK